jgi:DNA-directed RNA polymerase specialized sigma24 family protein
MATKDKLIEYRTINIKAIRNIPEIIDRLKYNIFYCLDDKIIDAETQIASFSYNVKAQVLTAMPRTPYSTSNPCLKAVELLQHYTAELDRLQQLGQDIYILYSKLSDRQMDVFMDYYVLGKTEQETADKIDINISTVSRILATIKNTPSFN